MGFGKMGAKGGFGSLGVLGIVDPRGLKNAQSSLPKVQAALAAQRGGTGFAKVLCVGDSTYAGAISDASLGNYRTFSWPSRLASLLTSAGYSASWSNALGNAEGPQGVSKSPGDWDSRLSGTGTIATLTNNNLGVGGLLLGNSSAAAATLSFAPGVSTDTCDIYYYDQGAVVTVNVDGGSTIDTIAMGGTTTCKKRTITYPAGVHTINVVWSSGTFNIAGFDAYLSSSPQTHILNAGSGSARSTNLGATTPNFCPINWYKAIAPDLTIIGPGINDWINGTVVSTYSSSVQSIIDACKISGDVILMTPFPSAPSQAAIDVQMQYVSALIALAYANGIGVLDEYANLGSKAAMTAAGLGSDVNHPNGAGHLVIAQDVLHAIRRYFA